MFSATVALAAAGTLYSAPAAPDVAERADSNADPALRLWRQWVDAHQKLCQPQQAAIGARRTVRDETGSTEVMTQIGVERDT